MKRYFLGLATNFKHPFRFLISRGSKAGTKALTRFLEQKYKGEAYLYKNGRTALAVALRRYLPEGARILVNGFTCYAVIEAVKAAQMTPVFVDISQENLNFDFEDLAQKAPGAQGIIIQNTLGNPVNITKLEKIAHKNRLVIIEDLAHSAGVLYPDGREAGTVGDASVLSFGKDKAVDTILGGAVVLRKKASKNPENSRASEASGNSRASETSENSGASEASGNSKVTSSPNFAQRANGSSPSRATPDIPLPTLKPRRLDNLRARLYPVLGLLCRKLTGIKLGGLCMRLALKLRLVEKSADNHVDFEHQIANFEAKEALKQMHALKNRPLRQFFLVENRDVVLRELKRAGYYFDAFWYETPVSPKRYFKKSGFSPEGCPVATEVSKHILNFPNYYNEEELSRARKIVDKAKKWNREVTNPETGAEKMDVGAVINSENRVKKMNVGAVINSENRGKKMNVGAVSNSENRGKK